MTSGGPEGEDSQLHHVPITLSLSYKHFLIINERKNSKKHKLLCHNCKTRLDKLPNLVLVNILSRLPIKSIFRCKCVCRAWYKLISDPYFVNTYLASTPFISVLLSFRHELSSWLELEAGNNYIVSLRNMIFPHKPMNLGRKFDLLEGPKKKLVVIGSCNGLLCLLHGNRHDDYEDRLYISNPTLRECVKVLMPSSKRVRNLAYGFGYSLATDKFKILRIAKKKYIRQPLKSEAEVYTIGVDHSWRDVGDAPFPIHGRICGVTLNGALHWIEETDYEGGVHLFSFDIQEEKVWALPSPHDLRGIFMTELGVLRNCLCIFDNNWSNQFDIWWMKDYGVGESWTRDRILRSWISPNISIRKVLPITIWRDGEILMVLCSGKMFSYNPKEKKSTQVKVPAMGDKHCKAILYVPSFVSLKAVMGEDAQMINLLSKS